MQIQKITIRNERANFATLWLEPRGEDYGMNPEELFEVVANDIEENFYFHVDRGEQDTKVWAEGNAKFVTVYKNGEMLECGHNRREEL